MTPRKPPRQINLHRAALRRAQAYGPFAVWIRTQPCLVVAPNWAHSGVIQACHIKSRGAGGKQEGNLMPLCAHHHQEQHRIGIKSFATKYGLKLAAQGAAIFQRYLDKETP